jgi:hypothetical protein
VLWIAPASSITLAVPPARPYGGRPEATIER